MPPKPLFDLSGIDLSRTVFGPEEIRKRNAQRYEMEMLDRVVYFDAESGRSAAVRSIRPDEFWARGHFPGQPLFPGVLMIESAGQLCSFFYCEKFGSEKVMGFAACENAKFRGRVIPGDQILLLSQGVELRPRIAIFDTQALVRSEIVFEGRIVGMPLR
jgi:3-hydroxyacyl-[acyl-carrier-protein] dehydratase